MVEKRKQALQELAFCFSLAALVLMEEWAFLDWALHAVYPRYPLRWTDLAFFGCALSAIAVPLWLLLRVTVARPKTRHWVFFISVLLLLLPLNSLRGHLNFSVYFPFLSVGGLVAALGPFGAGAVGVAALALLTWIWHRYGRQGEAALRAVVLCGFPFLLISFGRMGYAYWNHVAEWDETEFAHVDVKPSAKPYRVVWIIFDEWDYAMTFEKRLENVFLPELDALRKESLFATHAYSPIVHTHASIPAYLLGRQVTEFCRLGDNDIEVKFPPLVNRRRISKSRTILSQMADEGAAVSVAGWYHPYCKFLPPKKLAACESVMFYEYGEPKEFLSRLASIGGRALNPMREIPAQHLNAYQKLMRTSLENVGNPAYDVSYVHLSIPHLPGIYSRRRALLLKDRKSPSEELQRQHYYSNIVLVSRSIGQFIERMKETGVWDRTVLLITSDHAVHPWRWGIKDPDRRVPFLLRVPGAHPVQIDKPFNTVMTGALLRSIFNGQVGPGDLLGQIDYLAQTGPLMTQEPVDACPFNEM